MHELLHDLRIIVDPFKKHRLSTQGDPCIRQTTTGLFDLRGEFIRVVKVEVHVDGVVLFHDFTELGGDALREGSGHPCAKTNEFQVGNGPKGFQDSFD